MYLISSSYPYNTVDYVLKPDGRGHNDTREDSPECRYDQAHRVSAHNQQNYIG